MPMAEESIPFRWDLITPDQLGSLLSGTTAPDLWFLDDLVTCAGKVLARSANGDLVSSAGLWTRCLICSAARWPDVPMGGN